MIYIVLFLCGMCMTMPAQQDSIDLRQARNEVRAARKEMREAQAEVQHMKAELRKKRHVLNWHNELRIGWGDQIFESLMWHNHRMAQDIS